MKDKKLSKVDEDYAGLENNCECSFDFDPNVFLPDIKSMGLAEREKLEG
jgi:hypothetical protein